MQGLAFLQAYFVSRKPEESGRRSENGRVVCNFWEIKREAIFQRTFFELDAFLALLGEGIP